MAKERITERDLQTIVDRLNSLDGMENPQWNTAGSYQLDAAYGGWKLIKMMDNGGSKSITSGYAPKRELYLQLQGMLRSRCNDMQPQTNKSS